MIPKSISSVTKGDYLKHDYYQKISSYIEGENVLDVGCVDHDILDVNKKRLWNHWFLHLLAKTVVGIDIEQKSIKKMQQMGLNAILMSAEEITHKNAFDVVFAGELIEHLPNPGNFLKAAKRALKPKGKIILSTPNAYSINRIIRVLQFGTNEPPQNTDHTMCFSPKNVETLAVKCDLSVKKIQYAYFPFINKTFLIKGNEFACNVFGEKFKEQMIIELQ